MRNKITNKEIKQVVKLFEKSLWEEIKKKGNGAYISPHEVRGVMEEEFAEHMDELRANNLTKQVDELIDIAIAAMWGVASILKALKKRMVEKIKKED